MKSLINEILNKYWGYTSFRDLQEDIILSVLEGNDTLGLLPTGGEVCYISGSYTCSGRHGCCDNTYHFIDERSGRQLKIKRD